MAPRYYPKATVEEFYTVAKGSTGCVVRVTVVAMARGVLPPPSSLLGSTGIEGNKRAISENLYDQACLASQSELELDGRETKKKQCPIL